MQDYKLVNYPTLYVDINFTSLAEQYACLMHFA